MTIKAIIFDMDDTLYPERDYIYSGLKVLDQWVEDKFQVEGFFPLAIQFLKLGERKLIFNKTLEKMKVDFDKSTIENMVNVFRDHKPSIHLSEEARWVLNNVNDTVKLGLITDGYLNTQQKKIEALKIKEYFQSIVISDQYGRENWKPSPIPYIQSSMELCCENNECLYIGDNVKKDFITAKKLGWTTVHIYRNSGIYSTIKMESEYNAHYQISNLRELNSIEELKHLFNTSNMDVI